MQLHLKIFNLYNSSLGTAEHRQQSNDCQNNASISINWAALNMMEVMMALDPFYIPGFNSPTNGILGHYFTPQIRIIGDHIVSHTILKYFLQREFIFSLF